MDGQRDIVVSMNPTEEDYRRVLFKLSRKILFIWVPLILMFGLGFLLVLVWIVASPVPLSNKIPALLLPSLPLLFVCLVPTVILYNIRKQSRNLAVGAEPSQITFTSESMTFISPSSAAETLLSRFVKAIETESDFVLFPQKQVFVPIAKRFFGNDEDIVELRRRLVSNLGDEAKVLEK
jgi:hypothetical protein